jgi:hypothetical protein
MKGRMKMGRTNKPGMGELAKGNPYGNAFPPLEKPKKKETENGEHEPETLDTIQEENEDDKLEYNEEPNQDFNLGSSGESNNYLDALLEKKPNVIKRNIEVYEHIDKRLVKAARKYKYGFLKKFFNAAIEKELDWLDEQEEKMRKPKTKKPDQR